MAASCMQPAGRGYRRAKLSASGLRFGLGPEHHDAVGARLRRPDLALAPQHLPHGGIPAVAREAFETLGLRIEAQHRVGTEVGYPDLVGLVDIDRVRTRLRSEEHTSELQSLMRISYAVFCLKQKTNTNKTK